MSLLNTIGVAVGVRADELVAVRLDIGTHEPMPEVGLGTGVGTTSRVLALRPMSWGVAVGSSEVILGEFSQVSSLNINIFQVIKKSAT